MKLPVPKPTSRAAQWWLGAGVASLTFVCLATADETPVPTAATTPEASASPATPASGGKKKGAPKDPNAPKVAKTPKPNAPVSKEIPIILPIGESADQPKIPNFDTAGKILSMLVANKMTRIDANHLRMESTKLDLNKADGKSDYHITIPASIFDTQTHIITSDDPVVIRTDEFELTGERMRFNTQDRTGELLGNVRMVIHNLKASANFAPQQTPKPE